MQNNTPKQRVNAIFRNLRKAGFIAKQNFACCSSCGHYELGTDYPSQSYAFYNKQSNESIWKRGYSTLYIQFSGDGNVIAEIVRKHGFEVDWGGTPDKAVGIVVFPK